jgi:hypothetical protein
MHLFLDEAHGDRTTIRAKTGHWTEHVMDPLPALDDIVANCPSLLKKSWLLAAFLELGC